MQKFDYRFRLPINCTMPPSMGRFFRMGKVIKMFGAKKWTDFWHMRRKVVIKGIFNDYFTGYKDKESSVVVMMDGYKVIEQRMLKIKRLFNI